MLGNGELLLVAVCAALDRLWYPRPKSLFGNQPEAETKLVVVIHEEHAGPGTARRSPTPTTRETRENPDHQLERRAGLALTVAQHGDVPARKDVAVMAVRQPSSTTWKQIEKRFGKIDRAAFAVSLADRLDQFFIQTGKPWGMDETGGRSFPDFVAYLRQWGAKAGPAGDALPPELRGTEDFRLIHPWQIEQQKLNWGNRPFADPEASDGWAMRAKDEGWTMGYSFVATDDFTPGKRYKLFVRVQCPQPTTEGDAFACGIYGKEPLPRLDRTVPTALLTPGEYQVLEIGTLEMQPSHAFWIALVQGKNGYAVSEVRLDCLWLCGVEDREK